MTSRKIFQSKYINVFLLNLIKGTLMNKKLLSVLFLLLSLNVFAAKMPKLIQGTVIDTFIGELDPFVGDYCIVVVKSYQGQILALTEDISDGGTVCEDATIYEDKIGFAVEIERKYLSQIDGDDDDLISEIKKYVGDRKTIVVRARQALKSIE